MKIWISHFYNVRFLDTNQIPISTALFDPKWYQPKTTSSNFFVDNRGVINGLRASAFAMKHSENLCHNCNKDLSKCSFMPQYNAYLHSLDFAKTMQHLEAIATKAAEILNVNDPEIVLLVHEAPTNPCSERASIVDWFQEYGVHVEEYQKPKS